MRKLLAAWMLLCAFAFSGAPVLAAGLPAGAEDAFNHSSSIAFKYSLGTLLKQALGSASGVALTNGSILVGNGSGVATAVTPSGDLTMSNTGAFTIGANKVTVGDLAQDVEVETVVTLTQANLTGMNGAAVTLIAAPGANKLIVIKDIEWKHDYAVAAYTGGGVIAVQYHGSSAIAKYPATYVTAASVKDFWAKPSVYDVDTGGTGTGLDVTAAANTAVEITNATAAFAAGDATNTVTVRLRYRILTIEP